MFKRILLTILILITFTLMTGCGYFVSKAKSDTATTVMETTTMPAVTTKDTDSSTQSATEIGEGAKSFSFEVVGKDGTSEFYNVKTNETTVGAALLAVNLIAGDKSEYGLMVKTVNGVEADYDKDGAYWAFYINGEYATVGVDSAKVEDGKTYSFKYEKA
ncbi:MAG: DUF4430 domain-containing protein [Ruminococcus sp.]|jgi:uncharacterized protein YxeA|nr:DUF4430 domain-containing protein [Ruminococcus sp.]